MALDDLLAMEAKFHNTYKTISFTEDKVENQMSDVSTNEVN